MRNRLLCISGFILLLASVASADCQNDKAPVKMTLVVILASEEGHTIDPRLKAIAEEIQKLNPSLKSFRLQNMQSKSIIPGEKVSLTLVEDKKATMIVKHGANQDNRVELAVKAPSTGEIEYQTVCGKFLPIVTLYRTKSNERLILAIRVQPCHGEK